MNFYYRIENKELGYSYKLEDLAQVFPRKEIPKIVESIKSKGVYEDSIFRVKPTNITRN